MVEIESTASSQKVELATTATVYPVSNRLVTLVRKLNCFDVSVSTLFYNSFISPFYFLQDNELGALKSLLGQLAA